MALVMDPAGAEISALRKIMPWGSKQVLEVGCGDGRLTLRLAGLGVEKIIAFDADLKLIRAARRNLPDQYKDQILFRAGSAEKMRLKANQFDVVVFSWVL